METGKRVLTVTYGGFSCTLEGFDDPLAAMAEIAQCFRDLSTGDRQFDALPPEPDMAVIHGAAEVAARREVEGLSTSDELLLRAALVEGVAANKAAEGPRESAAIRLARMRQIVRDEHHAADAEGDAPNSNRSLAAAFAQSYEEETGDDLASDDDTGRGDGTARAGEDGDDTATVGRPWRIGANDFDRVRKGSDLPAEMETMSVPASEGSRETNASPSKGQEDPSDGASTPSLPGGEAASESDMAEDAAFAAQRAAIRTEEESDAVPADRPMPPDPDLERLFAVTDSRLTGAEAARRHANISHLKAAVAASRGDAAPSETRPNGEMSKPYRADLSRNVILSADRPPPLVLVSTQMIGWAPPVSGEFAEFSREVGAVDAVDTLEAAAVFCAKVMEQPEFARSRLIDLAGEAIDELDRDEGMRAFGQLLRRGTVRRIGPGRYALGTVSRYAARAERRAV